MDYGRRVYGTKSENYITFMSEITDKYVQSIGGQFTAGTKQPYLYDDYFSMQYIYNLKKKYLGGTPAAKLEDLGVTSAIVPEVSNLNTLFLVNFDGTYADSVNGIVPFFTTGNYAIGYYNGKSCLHLWKQGGDDVSAVAWLCPPSINRSKFELEFAGVGNGANIFLAGFNAIEEDPLGQIAISVRPSDGLVTVLCTDIYGNTLIDHSGYILSAPSWSTGKVRLADGIINISFNDVTFLAHPLQNSLGGSLAFVIALSQSNDAQNLFIDYAKISNISG